jgi:hypothetical protein
MIYNKINKFKFKLVLLIQRASEYIHSRTMFNQTKLIHSEFFTFVYLICLTYTYVLGTDLIISSIFTMIKVLLLASFKQFIIDKWLLDLKPSPIEYIMSIKFPLFITFIIYFFY